MLSFAPVHWQFHNMPIFTVKCFINMENSLYVVFTGWYIRNFFNRITKSIDRDHPCCARLPTININTENLLRSWGIIYLITGFNRKIFRKHQKQSSINWFLANCIRKFDRNILRKRNDRKEKSSSDKNNLFH